MGFKVVHDPNTPTNIYNTRIYLTAVSSDFIGTTITVTSFRRDFKLSGLSKSELDAIDSNIMCLIVAGTIFQVAAILQVVATNQLGLIYAGRAIGGFAVGIVTTVCPVYLAEVSPPAIRGRLVGFYEIAYQLAAVVGFWINYGIKETMGELKSSSWRIPMAVQLIPGGLLLFGIFFLKESPRYLLKMDKPDKASKNLCWLRTLPADDPTLKMNSLPPSCRSIENAINFYSPTLFADIGVSNTSLYTGVYGVLKAAASLVFFSFLVDSLGRRIPLIWGGTLSWLYGFLIYVAVYIKVGHPANDAVISASTAAGGKGAIAFILLFAIFYCMGWNGLAWVICAEIYPTNIRGFCAAWTAFWQWVMQLVIVRTTTLMSENLGWGMFLLFAMFNFASVIFVLLFIPETKGKTLEDMDVVFGYTKYNDALHEKSDRVMIEDTTKAAELRTDSTTPSV
ncbi:general substrate transporter [Gymnopus androsaceus JB14]|uniref:General substrate transporter n=1 Tax=Gymnopus androsaceus JB14 TaxID=1447944 RepID=A0A6A4H3K6_9AGAR|nr:general substrate transporter [Gymnopus androsaceus JB14]